MSPHAFYYTFNNFCHYWPRSFIIFISQRSPPSRCTELSAHMPPSISPRRRALKYHLFRWFILYIFRLFSLALPFSQPVTTKQVDWALHHIEQQPGSRQLRSRCPHLRCRPLLASSQCRLIYGIKAEEAGLSSWRKMMIIFKRALFTFWLTFTKAHRRVKRLHRGHAFDIRAYHD